MRLLIENVCIITNNTRRHLWKAFLLQLKAQLLYVQNEFECEFKFYKRSSNFKNKRI